MRRIILNPKRKGSFHRANKGQGITEYAAVLAFVALLVAVVFGTSQGSMAYALSTSYKCISTALDNLNRASSNP